MSYQRSAVRGTGSNQYGDKPPAPISPFEREFRQQRADMLRGALFDLNEEAGHSHVIDISGFVNPDSGLKALEWEDDFVEAAEKFTKGKMGAQGMLFGLMQYVPPGATLPPDVIPGLAAKLRTDGLFPYDHAGQDEESDAAVVASAFDRALYTRLYADAYREETRVLSAIDTAEGVVGHARHIISYLSEKNADRRVLEQLVGEAVEKVTELDELFIGDKRERSHLKSNLRVIQKDLSNIGFDLGRMKERAFSVENYATLVEKQVRGEYVRRSPFWMEAIHNRSFFAIRTGNCPSVERHLEEIDAMAQKAFECTSGLPVRDGIARKRQLKRVQRTIRNIQQAIAPHANGGDEPFRPPQDVHDGFAELRAAIFA